MGDKAPASYNAAGIGEVFQSVVDEVCEVYGRSPEGAVGFSEDDLRNPAALLAKLRNPLDQVSVQIRGGLAEPIRSIILAPPKDPVSDQAKQALVTVLRATIQRDSIYDQAHFATVILRPETQALLSSTPKGTPAPLLNRMLLEDAYPLEIWKMPAIPATMVNAVDIELTFKSVMLSEKGWVLFGGKDTDQSQMEVKLATRLTPPPKTL